MRYNAPKTPWDNTRDFLMRGGIPITLTLVIINVACFFVCFFFPIALNPFLQAHLGFLCDMVLPWRAQIVHNPWTLLTYPLYASGGPIAVALGAIFFWISGASLERSWGSVRFGQFFAAITITCAIALLAGGFLYRQAPPPLAGFYMPLSGLIVAFCMLNPQQKIIVYFFPVKALYVAIAIPLIVLIMFGPIFGPFACLGILAAALYVKYGRPWGNIGSYSYRPPRVPRGPDLRIYPPESKPGRRTLDGSTRRGPFDFKGRWQDHQERKRLEKLWKNSGFTEPERQWRDDERR